MATAAVRRLRVHAGREPRGPAPGARRTATIAGVAVARAGRRRAGLRARREGRASRHQAGEPASRRGWGCQRRGLRCLSARRPDDAHGAGRGRGHGRLSRPRAARRSGRDRGQRPVCAGRRRLSAPDGQAPRRDARRAGGAGRSTLRPCARRRAGSSLSVRHRVRRCAPRGRCSRSRADHGRANPDEAPSAADDARRSSGSGAGTAQAAVSLLAGRCRSSSSLSP